MSYQAYQKSQNTHETATQVEYRLLAQVTAALMEADERGVMDKEAIKALDWNRRVWSALSSDCAVKGNGLPKDIRAGIISLSIWVSKHTSGAIRGKLKIMPLVNINRTIMEGLSKQMTLQNKAAQQAAPVTVTQMDTSL